MVQELGNNSDSGCIHYHKPDCHCSWPPYGRFFRRARLKVEHNDDESSVFQPARTYDNTFTQKYLRIRTRNNGHKTAHNCVAQLRVLIPDNGNPMRFPSSDSKVLMWGRSPEKKDLEEKVDIHPIIGEKILHVEFSDSRFEQ